MLENFACLISMITMKPAGTQLSFQLRCVRRSFGAGICAGMACLLSPSTQAQNLFEADFNGGLIYSFTPDGARSAFASGLTLPDGVVFDSAGNLFVAELGGTILKFAPDGTSSTFASGLALSSALAIDSAGNLYAA